MFKTSFLSTFFSAINEEIEELTHWLAKLAEDGFELGMMTLAALFGLAVFATFFALMIGAPLACYAGLYIVIGYILSVTLSLVLANQPLLFVAMVGILVIAHVLRIAENLRILCLNYKRLQPTREMVDWQLVAHCVLMPHSWSLRHLRKSWAPFFYPH